MVTDVVYKIIEFKYENNQHSIVNVIFDLRAEDVRTYVKQVDNQNSLLVVFNQQTNTVISSIYGNWVRQPIGI